MVFIPDKPGHRRFALRNLTDSEYSTYARQYSRAKAGGIRCVFAWASGAGVLGVAKDVAKGVIIDYGKRKVAAVCLTAGGYVLSPAVMVFTNATQIVKVAKRVHGIAAWCFECAEDTTNLGFLPIDMAIFGQPIAIGAEDRFNLLNSTDFFN